MGDNLCPSEGPLVRHEVAFRPPGALGSGEGPTSADGHAGPTSVPASRSPTRYHEAASSQTGLRQLTVSNLLSQDRSARARGPMLARSHLPSAKSAQSSNASQWFRDSNQNVHGTAKFAFVDGKDDSIACPFDSIAYPFGTVREMAATDGSIGL